jgi:hypothetical protein
MDVLHELVPISLSLEHLVYAYEIDRAMMIEQLKNDDEDESGIPSNGNQNYPFRLQ